mgnify:CR=1 FL=1
MTPIRVDPKYELIQYELIQYELIQYELHKLMWETARANTDLYRQIFMCYPDDCYTKFSMINNVVMNKAQEYAQIGRAHV